jgi:ribokinase
MSTPIYIIGSSNTDMVVKAERLPVPGETILGGTFLMNAGGKGANQAVAAARLGGNVYFVANLGNDLFGKKAFDLFRQENINTNFITFDNTNPSGIALINVDANGENCIAVAPGANAFLTPELLSHVFDAITLPAFMLVQLEIPIRTVEYLIELSASKSIPIIINPAPANKIKEGLLKHVYAITPNETEAELLTGIKIVNDNDAQIAAKEFHKKGVKQVVITLGKRGAYWSDTINEGWIASPTVTAADTTAAGDCFSGALAVALADDKTLAVAVEFACVAASISVTRMGAQASMPTQNEVEEFLKEHP